MAYTNGVSCLQHHLKMIVLHKGGPSIIEGVFCEIIDELILLLYAKEIRIPFRHMES
jgi:hypothetical protein